MILHGVVVQPTINPGAGWTQRPNADRGYHIEWIAIGNHVEVVSCQIHGWKIVDEAVVAFDSLTGNVAQCQVKLIPAELILYH